MQLVGPGLGVLDASDAQSASDPIEIGVGLEEKPYGGRMPLPPIGYMLFLLPIGFTGGKPVRMHSIRDVAAAVRGRRQDLGLNQAELAKRAGVSRKWIYEFEAGKSTAEFGLVLRVLEELGFGLELGKDSDAEHQEASARRAAVDLDALLNELRARETSATDE